jgi:phosphoglycolate phosphatase-like HAD superfamily hydrolase
VKLLLFDIDQTLINSGGAGLRALDRACEKVLGLKNAMQGISPHGKTDPAIAREILRVRLDRAPIDGNDIPSILEAYVSFLKEEVQLSPAYRVLPGIVSLLEEMLHRQDVALGLATGNIELGARIKLERGGLNRYFEVGGFGSDSEDRTELVRRAAEKAADKIGTSIPPSNIFVIGDTPLDIDAGNRAGFKTIGVGTGSYSAEQLLAAGATAAVADISAGRTHFLRSTLME